MKSDKAVLISQDNQVIGEENKLDAHRHPAKLHRAVSVWLTNGAGKVFMQKRSQQKIVGAGWWGNTACGNVRPGETSLECAQRRLRDELGVIQAEISQIFNFSYAAYCNDDYGEREADTVFFGRYDGNVMPNPEEVSGIAWVDFNGLVEQVTDLDFPKPEDTLSYNSAELKKKTSAVKILINGASSSLAPWTVFMLRDHRLQKQFA